jgi:hypothetical protein
MLSIISLHMVATECLLPLPSLSQMGHAFGLFHVNEGPCDFPFGGDEVDDTPSEDSRRDNVFGGNDYDPPTWCPPEGVIDTCLWAG